MSIKVIGAGWGRTGTTSMMNALIALGFDDCYHFTTITPEDVSMWVDALEGRPVDWSKLFDGYGAVVDWPATNFYAEIAEHFPDAKVVLTSRDPAEWFESATATIYRLMSRPLDKIPDERPGWTVEQSRAQMIMSRRIVIEQSLGRPYEENPHKDRELVMRRFNEHLEAVRRTIPPERLLEFSVKQGWEPLCEFLEVPVPDEPFPWKNARTQFAEGQEIMQKPD